MKATKQKKVPVCSMCQKPATREVDGEPSCEQHAPQVYEHQLEDYTRDHLIDGEWGETSAKKRSPRSARTKSAEPVGKS